MWWIVTRYKTPTGTIIRHVYGKPDGSPYESYSGAHNHAKRMMTKARNDYPRTDWHNLEAHAVKVITYDAE